MCMDHVKGGKSETKVFKYHFLSDTHTHAERVSFTQTCPNMFSRLFPPVLGRKSAGRGEGLPSG